MDQNLGKHKIYLDYAATTPVDPQVLKEMAPYFTDDFGNPSEIHQWGRKARIGIEKAREKVAKALGAKREEIFFTSGATESINLSHRGIVETLLYQDLKGQTIKMAGMGRKLHIITSAIEHKAVLETCKHLEKLGWVEVTYLPVDKYGLVDIRDIEKAIKPETILISIVFVNNEVGTVEPIEEIGKRIKEINSSRISSDLPYIYFHTDATQAIQSQNCNISKLGVDLLSLTGHKFYAPKGIGVLFVKGGVPIIRQQDGGSQEMNLRAGTENVPYIVGLGEAIEMAIKNREEETKRLSFLRDNLIENIQKISQVELTGHKNQRAPHIASFIIKGVEGEALLLMLDEYGIAVSTGSACTSNSLSPSHVLTALGYSSEEAHGSLRFSLGKFTTKEEIDFVIKVMPEIIEKLRKMAPKLEEENYV